MKVSTVGLDLAKNVFQVHAVDEAGEVIVRKALRRRRVMAFFERLEPCLIGMEACGTSHYWGRELCALGHEDKLMPPAPEKMRQRRETVEHPFGTIKVRMGATHFLMKQLKNVRTEMALGVLAYNLTRVMNIMGIGPLIQAMRA